MASLSASLQAHLAVHWRKATSVHRRALPENAGQSQYFNQGLHNHLYGHRRFVNMPAVVIGDMCHGGVANFSLSGEEDFGGGGHADQRHTPTAEGVRLAASRKPWAFDSD